MFNKQGDEGRVMHSNIRGPSGGQKVKGWGGEEGVNGEGSWGTRLDTEEQEATG